MKFSITDLSSKCAVQCKQIVLTDLIYSLLPLFLLLLLLSSFLKAFWFQEKPHEEDQDLFRDFTHILYASLLLDLLTMISSFFTFGSSCREYEKAKENKEAVFPLVLFSVLNAAASILILMILTFKYGRRPYLYKVTYMFHVKMLWCPLMAGLGICYMYVLRRNIRKLMKSMDENTTETA